MSNITLICKDYEKFPESGQIIKAAKELNIPVFESSHCYNEYGESIFPSKKFHYGTCGFFMKYRSDDIFSDQEYIYDFSFLLGLFGHKKLLNYDALIIPMGKFELIANTYSKGCFVKPNGGGKSFAGTTILKGEKFNFGVSPWELIAISSLKPEPQEEYRFFCIRDDNDKIDIVGCRYLPDPSNEIPSFVLEKAREWASEIFDKLTVGSSFVLDLAYDKPEYEDEPGRCSIIELNSWNSSSFYSIDPIKILQLLKDNYES